MKSIHSGSFRAAYVVKRIVADINTLARLYSELFTHHHKYLAIGLFNAHIAAHDYLIKNISHAGKNQLFILQLVPSVCYKRDLIAVLFKPFEHGKGKIEPDSRFRKGVEHERTVVVVFRRGTENSVFFEIGENVLPAVIDISVVGVYPHIGYFVVRYALADMKELTKLRSYGAQSRVSVKKRVVKVENYRLYHFYFPQTVSEKSTEAVSLSGSFTGTPS